MIFNLSKCAFCSALSVTPKLRWISELIRTVIISGRLASFAGSFYVTNCVIFRWSSGLCHLTTIAGLDIRLHNRNMT